MKYKVRALLASALLIPALLVFKDAGIPSAEAQAASPSLCSGIQLQNTSTSSAATVQMNFYQVGQNDGSPNYQLPDTVGANGSKSYFLPNQLPSSVPDGQYSVVVNSDQALNALVNQVTCAGSSPNVAASFSGVGSADTGTTVYLPYILSRAFGAQGWASFVAIQNAGTANATNVKIDFYPTGGTTSVQTFTNNDLKVGETWYLNLRSGQYATAALNGFNGSATITSDQPVAAVANYAPGDNSSLLSYNGARIGGTTLAAPQFTKRFSGFTSGMTIVNQTATASTVRVTFNGTVAGNQYNNSIDRAISANGTLVVYAGNLSDSELATNFNGTAIVSIAPGASSTTLIGISNMAADGTGGFFSSGAMNLVPATQAATKLYLPQQTRNFSGFTSGWQIVNLSSNAITGQAQYFRSNSDGTVTLVFTQVLPSIPASSSFTQFLGAGSLAGNVPDGFNGGIVVTTSDVIAGQGNFIGSTAGDPLTIYNGFPG